MKKQTLSAWLLAGAAFFGFSGWAQAQPMMGGDHGGAAMQRMATELGLSADQQAQCKALHEREHAAMKANMAQHKAWAEKEHAAWAAPQLDEKQLETLRQEEVQWFDAMSKQRLAHDLAMAKILTPEQRAKMQSLKAEHMHHHGDMSKEMPKD